MSNYYNRQWRLPNEENKSKVSNYSMSFDGSSSQYITVPNNSSLNFERTDAFSISAWVKRVGSGSYQSIVYKANNNSPYNGYALYIDNNNKVGFNMQIDYFATNYFGKICTSVLNTDWNNVLITYNGNSNVSGLNIYINGSLQTVTTVGTSSDLTGTLSNSIPLNIGARNNTDLFFNGQIDAVAIYNYALTDGTGGTVNQIAALYGSSSTGIGNPMTLNPVAYYPLGDQDAFNGSNYLVPNSSLKDYVFDFNSSLIDCSNNSTIAFERTDAFSISVWLNFDSTSGDKAIVNKVNNSGSKVGYQFSIYGNNTGSYFNFILKGSTQFLVYFTDTPNETNVWNNFTVTYDGSSTASGVNFYKNSVAISQGGTSGSISTSIANTGNLSIGGMSGASSLAIDAQLSNVQIFNTALPATGSNSVETLYNNGSPLTSMSGFTSLQAWYKLDASATYDSSTTTWTIEDSSSNSNDGTSSGMTQANLIQSDLSFTSGYSPYALDFDGTNDYIDCGNDSSLVPSSLTISLWFKTSGSASAIPRLLNKSYGGSPYDSYFIRINNGVLNFKIGVSSASVQIAGTTNVVDGEWHNVIGTYDGSQLKLYLDGNSEATPLSETRAIIENTSYNLTLGCELGAYGFSWPFTGSMSNVSIWNTALTSAQVTEIHSEGVPQNLLNHSAASSLVSWWQLGSNSSFNTNWTVLDEKGSNNGVSSNMTEANIVDGVGSSANGTSSGMGGDEVVGSAFGSLANALSVNMDIADRTTDTPS